MATLPLPQLGQDLTEPIGQPGRVGQIVKGQDEVLSSGLVSSP
jgi:hypothetical protein